MKGGPSGGSPACRVAWLLAGALLVWPAVLTQGAESPPGPGEEIALRLTDVVELALLEVDRLAPSIARWRLKEEEGRLWPTLSLRGRAWFEHSPIATRDTGTEGDAEDVRRLRGELALSYNLLQFLSSLPRLEGARAEERAAVLRLTEQQSERVLRAARAYLALVADQEWVSSLERLHRERAAFAAEQQERVAAQAVAEIELVRARARLLGVERELVRARRQVATTELELRQLTGLRPTVRLVPYFEPEHLDLSAIEDRGLDGLLALAREANPRLLASLANAESARWEMEATRARGYPTLSLSAAAGYGYDEVRGDVTRRGHGERYSVFLTLNIPIFDGGVQRAQEEQSRLRAASLARAARQATEQVKADIESAYWTFREREDTRQLLERELGLAREELRQLSARIEAGAERRHDALVVSERITRLEQDLALTRVEGFTSGIALLLAIGRNPFAPVPEPSARATREGPAPASAAMSPSPAGSQVNPVATRSGSGPGQEPEPETTPAAGAAEPVEAESPAPVAVAALNPVPPATVPEIAPAAAVPENPAGATPTPPASLAEAAPPEVTTAAGAEPGAAEPAEPESPAPVAVAAPNPVPPATVPEIAPVAAVPENPAGLTSTPPASLTEAAPPEVTTAAGAEPVAAEPAEPGGPEPVPTVVATPEHPAPPVAASPAAAPAGSPRTGEATVQPASIGSREPTRLKQVVLTRRNRVTRVLLVATGPLVGYRTFSLVKPRRFVLDLPGLANGVTRTTVAGDGHHLLRVRIGHQPDALRIVLDLGLRAATPVLVTREGGLEILLQP